MKNLKKVLAMVLAFACTFSMFAGAKVFEDVPAGSDYSEAVTMLSDLGIIQGKDDGKYHPEDTITRAEACAMIARLMTGDPNVSQYVGAQSFTDVAKGSWKDSAIGYCYINGIVIGVGNNKFEPDRAITDAEFITMVVRAMGYETADMKQNYPYSYMSNAQAIGLLDGTNMVASTDALRGEDAQVIYNALFTDYARGAMLVNTTHGTSVEQYPVLAEQVWGLNRAAVGTWDEDSDGNDYMKVCKAHTWVITGEVGDKDNTFLAYPIEDGTTDIYETEKATAYQFTYEGSGNIADLKGYKVELWGAGTHSEPELETITNADGEKVKVYSFDWKIQAVKTVKGQTAYDYNASMYDSKETNGEIELDDVTLDLDSVADNNDVLGITDEKGTKLTSAKAVETAVNHKDGNTYKLIDWDNDDDVDFITVDKANYYKVETVTSKKVIVNWLDTASWQTATDNNGHETWNIDGINNNVEYVVPDDLKEGDIVEVTSSTAYNSDEKDTVTTYTVTVVEPETAELTKVSTKGGLELSFDDEVVELAEGTEKGDLIAPENPDMYDDFAEEELGTNFALYKNRNGFIVYTKYADADTATYAMVLDTADGRNTLPRELAELDLLNADNSISKSVKVAADVKVEGLGDAYTEDEERGEHDGRHWDESEIVGQIVKYYTDKDGVITKIVGVSNDEYSDSVDYVAKNDRMTLDDGIVSLEDANALFVVRNAEPAGSNSDVLGYIQQDGKSNDGLFVDPSDVMAVKAEDMPNLEDADGDAETTNAIVLDPDANNELAYDINNDGDYAVSGVASFLSANTSAKIAYSLNNNSAVKAAIIGVESFDKFNASDVTVGLLTYVDASGKEGSKDYQVTLDVAIDGKFQEDVACREGDELSDIFKNFSGTTLKDIRNDLDNGAYVEITRNADGAITQVRLMDDKGGNELEGQFYTVSREAIGQVKADDWFSTYSTAYYNNDESMYTLSRTADGNVYDVDNKTVYYTIDTTPSIYQASTYYNVELDIAQGFGDELATYKNGALKSTDLNTEAVGSEALIASYVNNSANDIDDYYVADVVTKKASADKASMIFAYQDGMDEVAPTGKVVITPNPAADVRNDNSAEKIADVTRVAGGGNVTGPVEIYTAAGVKVTDITGAFSGTALQITAPTTAATGDYTAKFTVDGVEYKVDFTVNAADVTEVKTAIESVEGKKGVEGTPGSYAVQVKTPANASEKLEVRVTYTTQDGEKQIVDAEATANSSSSANNTATDIVNAINSKLDLKNLFDVTASSDKVRMTVKDTSKVASIDKLEVSGAVVLGTPVTTETEGYVKATKGVATLTILDGISVNETQNYKLKMGTNYLSGGPVAVDATMTEADIAEAIAAAYNSLPYYTVEAEGNVVTVTQKNASDNAMALTFEKQ